MSLISDALRKAQKQRTGELPPLSSMPAIGGESATRIAKRAKPAGFYTLLIRLGAGVILLAVVIIGGVILLRKKSLPVDAPQPAGQTAARSEPTTVPAQPQPATTTVAPPVAPATTFVVPVAVTPPAVTAPKTEAPAPRNETPQPVAATTPAPVSPKPEPVRPAGPTKLEPKAIIFIESLRVVGIRASATDSKVLMNDRVYRIGNVIEHEMGIKLTGITTNSLTFEDERGGRYTRTF